MKKSVFLLISLFSFIILSSFAIAGTCFQDKAMSCSATPDSLVGFGAVDICQQCYVCGAADGVCPEDFYSSVTNTQSSCRMCTDPDCTTSILNGSVTDAQGNPIPTGEIYGIFGYGEKYTVAQIENGKYEVKNSSRSGYVKLYARYEDYDSPGIVVELKRGEKHTVDFTNAAGTNLEKGSCNSDCTGTFRDRCRADCDGVAGCEYEDLSSTYTEYTSSKIAELCDERSPDTLIKISETSDEQIFIQCCSGTKITKDRKVLDVQNYKNENKKNLASYNLRIRTNEGQGFANFFTWQ